MVKFESFEIIYNSVSKNYLYIMYFKREIILLKCFYLYVFH